MTNGKVFGLAFLASLLSSIPICIVIGGVIASKIRRVDSNKDKLETMQRQLIVQQGQIEQMQSQIESQINLQTELRNLQNKIDSMKIDLEQVNIMKTTQLSQMDTMSKIKGLISDMENMKLNMQSVLSQQSDCERCISDTLNQIQSDIRRYPNSFSTE